MLKIASLNRLEQKLVGSSMAGRAWPAWRVAKSAKERAAKQVEAAVVAANGDGTVGVSASAPSQSSSLLSQIDTTTTTTAKTETRLVATRLPKTPLAPHNHLPLHRITARAAPRFHRQQHSLYSTTTAVVTAGLADSSKVIYRGYADSSIPTMTVSNKSNNNSNSHRINREQRRQAGTSAGNYAPTSNARAVPFNATGTSSHHYDRDGSANNQLTPSEQLPALPVPSLRHTMERLKESVAPFAMNSQELAETLELIDEFEQSAGRKLSLLLERKATQTKNWMSHDWWTQEAYLRYRDSLMCNSNPAMIFPRCQWTSNGLQVNNHNGQSVNMSDYLARLVSAMMDCREAIASKANLESSWAGGRHQLPLCFDQYMKVFGTTRRPALDMDSIHIQDLSQSSSAAAGLPFKIVVSHRNSFYEVDLSEHVGSSLSGSLDRRLHAIRSAMEIVIHSSSSNISAASDHHLPALGSLTILPRDQWARAHQLLDGEALSAIQEAQFVLCLDTIDDQHRVEAFLDDSTHQRELSKQILHADSGNLGNRWYDKTLQLIVVTDHNLQHLLGTGINYEHTVAEATTVARMVEFVVDRMTEYYTSFAPPAQESDSDRIHMANETAAADADGNNSQSNLLQTRHLSLFNGSTDCSSQLSERLAEAKQHYDIVTNQFDLEVLQFSDYGKRAIKGWQFSPDSWIQLALSLSYYQLHGHLAPCYESASVRRFAYGRTETIRSTCHEVAQFCMAPSYESLEAACLAHNKLAREAANGHGIDRALLGYRLTFNEIRSGQWRWGGLAGYQPPPSPSAAELERQQATGVSIDDIFTQRDVSVIVRFLNNKLLERSRRFTLSTSQVNSVFPATFLSYGPLVPDGYGCCYNPTSDQLAVSITANTYNPSLASSSTKYRAHLEDSLIHMRNIVNERYISKSKL